MSDKDLVKRGDVKAKKVYCDERHEYVVPVAEIDWLRPAVPQEMSAMEYLKMRDRMAIELGELCSACHCEGKCWDCPYHAPDTEDEMKHPDRSVALVEKWAREHPERSGE